MDLQSLIQTYGYAAILVGTFLEGETVLVLGGYAAHRGYLFLPWVILAAFVGSLAGDQFYFYLGRNHSRFILDRFPSWKPRVARARLLLDRFHTPLILSCRFLYGLRTVTPFAIGMSGVPRLRFFVLNAIGAAVWAPMFGTGGYIFGKALEALMGNLERYELWAVLAILALVLLIWLFRSFDGKGPAARSRRRSTAKPRSDSEGADKRGA